MISCSRSQTLLRCQDKYSVRLANENKLVLDIDGNLEEYSMIVYTWSHYNPISMVEFEKFLIAVI